VTDHFQYQFEARFQLRFTSEEDQQLQSSQRMWFTIATHAAPTAQYIGRTFAILMPNPYLRMAGSPNRAASVHQTFELQSL